MIKKIYIIIFAIICLSLINNHSAIACDDGFIAFIGESLDNKEEDTLLKAIVYVDADYNVQEMKMIQDQYIPITCLVSQDELYFYSVAEQYDEYKKINIYKFDDGDMHTVFEDIYIPANSLPLLIDKDLSQHYKIQYIADFDSSNLCLVEDVKFFAKTFRNAQSDRIQSVEMQLGGEYYIVPIDDDCQFYSGIPWQNCPIGVNKTNGSFFTLLPLSEKEIYSISLFVQEDDFSISSPIEIRHPLHSIWNLCTIDLENEICSTYCCGVSKISLIDLKPISNYMIYNEKRNSFVLMCTNDNPIEAFEDEIFILDRIVLVEIGLTSGTVDIVYESGYFTPDYQVLIQYIWKMYGVCYADGWNFTTLSEEEEKEFYSLQEQTQITHDSQKEIELNEDLFAVWNGSSWSSNHNISD